jgi:putative serine protease PepD
MTEETPEYPTYPHALAYGGYPPPGPPSGDAPMSGPSAPFAPAPPAPPAGTSARRTVVTAAIVAALVGGGAGAGTVALVDDNNNQGSAAGLTISNQAAPAAKVDGTVAAAAAKIGPSVVTVNVDTAGEQDTGSGVIIRSDGYILTNNHVIAAATTNSGRLTATLSDGRKLKASVVGTDPSDDLAVIRVGARQLTAATFSSSSKLVVGQTVVAVGAPLGLSDTVTAGIVSNTARPVQTGDSTAQAVFNAVQTDAAINPGNSGGPLVDLAGRVVGINAAIATDQSNGGLQVPGQSSQSGNIGIGFAIPSDEASRIAAELITSHKATHAVLGVKVTNNSAGGAAVESVTAHSPAARAGIVKGDVVTKLAGQRIDDANSLVAAVRSHAPGQAVAISYVRDGHTHTATVKLGSASQ